MKSNPINRRNRRQLKNEIKYLNSYLSNELLEYRIEISSLKKQNVLKKIEYEINQSHIETMQSKLKLSQHQIESYKLLYSIEQKQVSKFKFWAIMWASVSTVLIALFIIIGFLEILLSI